jgi:hypothetical protein
MVLPQTQNGSSITVRHCSSGNGDHPAVCRGTMQGIL